MEDIYSTCKDFISSGKICYSCGRELCGNNKCKDKQQCDSFKTVDHIPPISLFEQNKGYSNINANPEIDKITVPCCTECNNKYSKDDEIFVTFITMIASRTSKIAEYAYEKNRLRGIYKNRRLLQDIRNNIKGRINIKSPSGIYLGEGRKLHMTKERVHSICNVLKKIVKGYYYKKTKSVLYKEIKFSWNNFFFKRDVITGEYRNRLSEDLQNGIRELERESKNIIIGDKVINIYSENIETDVFSYGFSVEPIDEVNRDIIFVMTFYGTQKFVLYTDSVEIKPTNTSFPTLLTI